VVTHVGRGLFLGVSHAPTQGGEVPALPNLGFLSIYAYTLLLKYQIWHGNTYGEGACFGGQPRPDLKRAGPSAPQFWGFPSIYAYTLCRRTTKFDVVTQVGRGRLSRGQPCLPSQECGVPALLNFWGSPAFMPTPFNTERPNSAW